MGPRRRDDVTRQGAGDEHEGGPRRRRGAPAPARRGRARRRLAATPHVHAPVGRSPSGSGRRHLRRHERRCDLGDRRGRRPVHRPEDRGGHQARGPVRRNGHHGRGRDLGCDLGRRLLREPHHAAGSGDGVATAQAPVANPAGLQLDGAACGSSTRRPAPSGSIRRRARSISGCPPRTRSPSCPAPCGTSRGPRPGRRLPRRSRSRSIPRRARSVEASPSRSTRHGAIAIDAAGNPWVYQRRSDSGA